MNQIDKNTVSAKNQLKETEYVTFINGKNDGIRVLFVGNSITRHGKAPQIGWNNDWGMAASAIEKDYVHLIVNKVNKNNPDASFCICQVAEWERNFKTGSDTHELYKSARDFLADIIIMRCIENCPQENFDYEVFNREYKALIDYLNPEHKAKIILTTGFWKHVGDGEIRKISEEKGYPMADLGYIGENEKMKAIGKFEHSGVANHPGDLGMQAIASDIWKLIKNEKD